ncbi:hypothetical protein ACFSZS_00680 [Seohaeicola zhoushanensis]
MDRLQQAISKARRERSETVAREVQTPVAAAISAARQASAEAGRNRPRPPRLRNGWPNRRVI